MDRNGVGLWHTASVQDAILIALEGIDGAGKTAQANILSDDLQAVGLEVVLSKEPTNGVHGNRIRESASSGRMPLEEELQAFIADRREHVSTVIQPALEQGKIVVLDRYYYSTMAYQGAREADINDIRQQTELFAPIPDVVFLLDVDPSLGLFRIAEFRNETPNEFERLETLQKVREVFHSLPDSNLVRIDGSPSVDVVHATILEAFINGALKAKRCAKEYGCDDPMHCGPRFTGQCEWWTLAGKLRTRLLEPDPSPR